MNSTTLLSLVLSLLLNSAGIFAKSSGKSSTVVSNLLQADSMELEDSQAKKKNAENVPSCCKNGGQCILQSFCVCPKNFYGRYCEHEIHFRNCRHVPHGYWIKSDCNLCKCYDGKIRCVPHVFDGCDPGLTSRDMKETKDPFQGTDIDVAPPSHEEQTDDDYMYQRDRPTYNAEDYYYVDTDVPNKSDVTSVSYSTHALCVISLFLSNVYLS